MVWGLVGDDCKKESAEKCEAEAGGQHDVARRKGGFEFGFGFVGHGFGFGGWKKRMCVGEAHPLGGVSVRTRWNEFFLPCAFFCELSVRLKIQRFRGLRHSQSQTCRQH